MSVRWVPTVEDDFEYQRKTQERASTLRLRLAGTSLEIPFAKMPCPFPEEWGEVSNVKVDLYDVNGLEGAEREAAIAGLDDMRGQDGLEEMNLIPFGKITPAGGPKGQRPLRLVLLEDGGVSIIPLNNNENMLYITDMMTFSAFCGIRDEE